MPSKGSTGYFKLLKTNVPFRHLWYGQVVSELGDWLNSMAIYALILKLSGSGMAMAAAMMAKLLPIMLVSPFAGVLIDRMNRKMIMIGSDVLRFFIVLGFLFVEEQGDLWLVYALTVLEIAMAGFFEPARSALIPSITPKKHLVTANALSGSTWSVMLAFGAALGGVVVSLLGIRVAFILDAFTFLVSAWFISRITIGDGRGGQPRRVPGQGGFRDLLEGARYLLAEPMILVVSLLKSGLAVAGGIMTLIPLYAHQILATPAAVSMGVGILYSCRGIGAALGPILVKRFFGESSQVLRASITGGFFLGGLAYFLLGRVQTLWLTALLIGLATLFGSIIWVFSSALLHLEADERFLGRVFSAEMGLLTLVMAVSNWGVGFAVDELGFTLSQVAYWMAGLFLVPGVMWAGFLLFVRNRLRTGKCVGSVCPVDPSGFNPLPVQPVEKP